MAQLNSGIILQGAQPNILAAIDAGQQAGARQNAIQQQNALTQAYKTDGAGILAGDQGALNRLAAIDAPLAMDFRTSQQTMQVNAQNAQLRAAELAATLDQATRTRASELFTQGANMIATAQTPEQFQSIVSRPDFVESAGIIGITPDMLTFENRQMLAAAAMGAADAMKLGAGPEPTAGMQEYEFARSQGFDGTFADWKASGRASTNVTVNTGEGEQDRYLYGSDAGLPAGWRLDRQTGQASRIPGGPAAVEAEQEQAASQRAAESAAQNEQTRSDVVLQTTAGIRNMLDRGGLFNLPEVGVVGEKLRFVNQEAADMAGMLDTLKGMVAFDRLQKLQQASATGASGLGQVTEREIALLAAQMGALDQSLSAPLIRQTLDTVESVFSRLSPAAQAYLMGQADSLPTGQTPAAPQQPQGVPAGVDPGVWEFMTPEEKALFQ